MLRDTEKEIYARTPKPREAPAGNSVLAPQDVSDGLQSLRISIERISHDAGRQVPNEIEQFTRTKPARDTSNTLVTPCGDQRPRGCLADPGENNRSQRPGPSCKCDRSNSMLSTEWTSWYHAKIRFEDDCGLPLVSVRNTSTG